MIKTSLYTAESRVKGVCVHAHLYTYIMEYSSATINNENLDSLGGPVDKNTPASAGDMGLTPGP